MSRYTTATDAHQAIREALDTEEANYDVDAIFAEAYTYRVDKNDAGDELLNTAGFEQIVDTEGFWAIVARHKLGAPDA